MSRNREAVKAIESESDSDDGSSEEDSEPQPTPKKSTPQPPPSSSEEESETDKSESDEPVKPIKEAQKLTPKTGSKPTAAAKRPAAAEKNASAKKKKTTDDPEKKSNFFQRLFTDEDEIVLLQGLVDYKAEKNADPTADWDAFHEFINKDLHTDIFSRSQVQDKVRRLKKKFNINKGKGKRNFSKAHEQKAYDLSLMFWGEENGVVANGRKKANGDKNVKSAAAGSHNLSSSCGGASVEHAMLITGRDLYERGLGIDGEDEWNKLRAEELQLYLKQLQLRALQTKLVLDMVKRHDHN